MSLPANPALVAQLNALGLVGNCSIQIRPVLTCSVDPLCPENFNEPLGEDCLRCPLVGTDCVPCDLLDPAEQELTNLEGRDFPPDPVQITCNNKNKNVCFAKDTTLACRVADAGATPAEAYDACYDAPRPHLAERVLMAELAAGDVVLTGAADGGGSLAFTRVLVNEKRAASVSSPVLVIETSSGGRLSVTPDHALFLDGQLAPASAATVGAVLASAHGGAPAHVRRISARVAHVVNPITLSGTILASEGDAPPLLAPTAQMWIAPFLVEHALCRMLLPLSPSAAAARAFPAAAQAYYDRLLEPLFTALTANADTPLRPLPTALLVPLLAFADVLLVAGFVAFGLATFAKALATLALVSLGARALRKTCSA